MTDSRRRPADIATGVALLAIPFLTTVVKFIAPGWMLLIYAFGLVVFLPVYALVVAICVSGFFAVRNPFAFVRGGRLRSRIAGWTHPVAFLLATAVLVDGGDDGSWSSPLAVLLGLPSNSAVADAANVAAYPLAIVSALAGVWLVVEWIVALVARRRATGSATD